MGIENGVLITHDYLRQQGLYRMSPSTGVAVVLNTLTTMVGFAVLVIADHRGLQSLGRVLTIGMACCLFSSLVILPTLMAWLTRSRAGSEPSAQRPPQADRGPIELRPHAAVHRRIDGPHPLVKPTPLVPRRASSQRSTKP
jgi:uncharacterized membrane protein YdfJ with MMPL/SSD domain